MKRRNKRKLKKTVIPIFIIVVIMVIAFIYLLFKEKTDDTKNDSFVVNLVDNLDILVKSEVNVSSLITSIEGGNLLEDELVDTSKIGKKKVIIKVKTDDEVVDYDFVVNVIDNEKPIIECDDNINIYVNDEVDLLSYVTVTDNYDKEFDIRVEGEYDTSKVGSYSLRYVVKDSSNNESIKEFILSVNALKYKKMADKSFTTSKGYTLTIKNGVAYVDGILIANKTYYLPENYTPVDSYNSNITDNCPTCLSKDVMSAFNEMKSDMSNLGLNIWIASGYRSYATQKYLYNNYVARDGKAEADTYSARAGYSEHQTGLCFDLNSVSDAFSYTDEGKWVNDNCYLYGFIIRYPKGKESSTGYMHESWHLRYVGKELAKKLYNDGDWITLEEYFGITSKYED